MADLGANEVAEGLSCLSAYYGFTARSEPNAGQEKIIEQILRYMGLFRHSTVYLH